VDIYYSSQFAPLVVFFLLFLAVVKNTKLPHFVRFNCMQGIMIDIVTMLFNILRTYFPAELRWSVILDVRLASCCIVKPGYCAALRGAVLRGSVHTSCTL